MGTGRGVSVEGCWEGVGAGTLDLESHAAVPLGVVRGPPQGSHETDFARDGRLHQGAARVGTTPTRTSDILVTSVPLSVPCYVVQRGGAKWNGGVTKSSVNSWLYLTAWLFITLHKTTYAGYVIHNMF